MTLEIALKKITPPQRNVPFAWVAIGCEVYKEILRRRKNKSQKREEKVAPEKDKEHEHQATPGPKHQATFITPSTYNNKKTYSEILKENENKNISNAEPYQELRTLLAAKN